MNYYYVAGVVFLLLYLIWLSWKVENLLRFREQAFSWMQNKETELVKIRRALTKEQLSIYRSTIVCNHCKEVVPAGTVKQHDGSLRCPSCHEPVG